MTISELYIAVGGLFSLAYAVGWALEQREVSRRIAKQKTATFDWIVSKRGRKFIDRYVAMTKKSGAEGL